jgi:hypothetical protein
MRRRERDLKRGEIGFYYTIGRNRLLGSLSDRLWRGDKFYERMLKITAAYLMK